MDVCVLQTVSKLIEVSRAQAPTFSHAMEEIGPSWIIEKGQCLIAAIIANLLRCNPVEYQAALMVVPSPLCRWHHSNLAYTMIRCSSPGHYRRLDMRAKVSSNHSNVLMHSNAGPCAWLATCNEHAASFTAPLITRSGGPQHIMFVKNPFDKHSSPRFFHFPITTAISEL
jgi:hypothetical protein